MNGRYCSIHLRLFAFAALALLALCPLAGADSTGPLTPASVSTSMTQGTSAPWTSPSRSMGSDDLPASATSAFNATTAAFVTDSLLFTFDLSGIPDNATINGMVLMIEGHSFLGNRVRCGISSGGFPNLDWAPENPDQFLPAGPGDSMVTFGSPTDNWSGVTLAVLKDTSNELGLIGFFFTGDTYDVDDVTLEVFFTRGVGMPASSSWTLALTTLLVILLGPVFVQEIRTKLS